ncbi:hypothetical protein KY285_007990 [Solanum tuberosum]|nr:hypothetical protein KY285_007990 [Solanum tuberosum]
MEQLIHPAIDFEAGRGRSTLRIRWFSIMTWCPPSDELFLKFDGVLATANHFILIQNTFTNTIKDKVGETSTLRNEEGLEVDDGDMERNTTTNGEDEGEKTSEDDVNLLKTQRMTNMQEHVQMDIRENMEAQVTIAVRAAVARMLGFTHQPPTDGSSSTPNVH